MKYLKLFADFLDYMEELNNEERGRLFTAMLLYTRSGEAPALTGNERFLWGVARSQLDKMSEQYQKVCAANTANSRKKSEAAARNSAADAQTETEPGGSARETAAAVQADMGTVREDPAPAGADSEPDRESAADAKATALSALESSAPLWENPIPALPLNCSTASAATVEKAVQAVTTLAASEAANRQGESRLPSIVAALPMATGEYLVFSDKASEWARKYPDLDVPGELGRMRNWLLSHTDRLAARKDVIPFILRWLDKVSKNRRSSPRQPGSQFGQSDREIVPGVILAELEHLMRENSGE